VVAPVGPWSAHPAPLYVEFPTSIQIMGVRVALVVPYGATGEKQDLSEALGLAQAVERFIARAILGSLGEDDNET